MRFGGHETFPIREGWLHKGLRILNEDPELLSAEDLADHLGVGRNMGKSIRHWLQATQLAEKNPDAESGKRTLLQLTDLGHLIWKRARTFYLRARGGSCTLTWSTIQRSQRRGSLTALGMTALGEMYAWKA
jgi:DNA-binding MarR family transcriptional regulator